MVAHTPVNRRESAETSSDATPLSTSSNAPERLCHPTVDDALTLARYGLPIIPLKPSTKAPRYRDWQKLYSTNQTVIEHWWRQCPGANVGYVIQRGMLVIDVDPRNGGLVGWNNCLAQHGDLPATWCVWSGRHDGGFHLYFTLAEDVEIPEATGLDQGVQILGPRHLVVLPPSLHPNTGQAYTWNETSNPFTMPTPTPAPAWLIALTLETATRHAPKKKLGDAPALTAATTGAQPQERRGSERGKPPGECYAGESTKVPRPVPPPPGTLVDSVQTEIPQQGPGKHLVDLACNHKHLPALLEVCGLPSTLEVGHTTWCPFHDDQHPSASLLGPTAERHSYGLYCHASACKRYYSLLDIFKARTSANLLSIHTETDSTGTKHDHTALRLQWLTRMLEAAGILHLYELGCPSLPPNAPAYVRDVWETFLHVRRIRSATRKASDPMPCSWRFIKDWIGPTCDGSQHLLQKAKSWLIARGLWHADHEEKGMTFWRIGSKALRRTRRDAPVLKTERENVADVEATPVPEPVAHTGHAWSAAAPAPARVCPLAEEPGHEESTCILWQAWLRTEAKKRLYGSPPLKELHTVDWEALYAP